jgi:hypothetical protein
MNRDASAFFREAQRDTASDAFGGAGHQNHAILQGSHAFKLAANGRE